MTLMWWLIIHASIPVIIPLRLWLDIPKAAIPLFIVFAVAGQMIGYRFFPGKPDKEEKTANEKNNNKAQGAAIL